MKKFLLVVLVLSLGVCLSFGAVKFKGDLITVGDFKYMQSNYVYNNTPIDPYFGLDNVEFIVNFGTKLELTSDVYGMVNLIVQPTTKFKHVAVDNLMINYFHKASKVKIVPFYRYRVAKFDDPENSIGWFNSWVISSSVFGVGNITNSKVDNNGFYVDSSSTARAGGIPYLLRPVEFMDGTIVSMPGMGEDTTNLSFVGRDIGGFYAEQRAKNYLWQVFLGGYFIDNSGGALNLSGGANVKVNLFEIEDIVSLYLGLLGNFYRFSGASLSSVELINSYIYTVPDLRNFASLYNYGGYLIGDTQYGKLYVQVLLNSQGQLLASGNYNEILTGGGYRVSGGGISDIIPGLVLQLMGSYGSYYLVTNTNQGVKPESAGRYDVSLKVFGNYETLIGESKMVLEAILFSEDKLNRVLSVPEIPASFSSYLSFGLVGKGGVSLKAFDIVDFRVAGSYESIRLVLSSDTNKSANVSKISARGGMGIDFSSFLIEGLVVNIDGGIFMWSDNLKSAGFLTSKNDSNLQYIVLSPNIVYRPSKVVSLRVGYGYPIFGDVFDIDYGLISDSLPMSFYKGTNNLYEGIYGYYVLQNLPRVYVDLKISF